MTTPYELKILYAPKLKAHDDSKKIDGDALIKSSKSIDDSSDLLDESERQIKDRNRMAIISILSREIRASLKLQNERPINVETFRNWFGTGDNYVPECAFDWIDTNRDFIYTEVGLKLLKSRYLRKNEPIQYAMLRIARLFVKNVRNELDLLHIFYDLISTGMIHVSSILADAEIVDSELNPGEACRLMVTGPKYDSTFIKQISKICLTTELGVGVGFSAACVPRFGYEEKGLLKKGFASVVKKIDSCNYLSVHHRSPKAAMYIPIHNDSIFEALEVKHPTKYRCENVFIGLMISNYFMKCVEQNKMWYLFPGDLTLDDGTNLHDCNYENYESTYNLFVESKLYTEKIEARTLMKKIVIAEATTGSPYIIWSDNVNKYNNQAHLGNIKTLNLCAEITNYSDYDNPSSCTLLSLNISRFNEHIQVIDRSINYMTTKMKVDSKYFQCDKHSSLASYSFMLAYFGALGLNNLLKNRKRREIGLNPLGVFDVALILNDDHEFVTRLVSEFMYKGAIKSSCDYSRRNNIRCENYENSYFSKGIPQWKLRELDKGDLISEWDYLCREMTEGMANSMLTSQAPTASTSLLTGATESVMIPMSLFTARESGIGRNLNITYGYLFNKLKDSNYDVKLPTDVESQVNVYALSAPFVDHSQSTMFSIDLKNDLIYKLIKLTYLAKLKTGIYYILPRQRSETLKIIRSNNSNEDKKEEALTKYCSSTCDSCTL